MKKMIVNFLFILMMSVSYQAVSATLSFSPSPLFGGDDHAIEGAGSLNPAGDSGQVVQGEAIGISNWQLELSEERLVSFEFSDPTGLVSFTNSIFGLTGDAFGFSVSPNSNLFTLLLQAGEYNVFAAGTPSDATYFVDIGIVNTPIPAAAWLFGSAVIGFIGVTRRKSTTSS